MQLISHVSNAFVRCRWNITKNPMLYWLRVLNPLRNHRSASSIGSNYSFEHMDPFSVISTLLSRSKLPFQEVSFLPNGDRIPEIIMQKFVHTSLTFEVTIVLPCSLLVLGCSLCINLIQEVMENDSLRMSWNYTTSPVAIWRDGSPPPDRPKCGIRGDLCFESFVKSETYIHCCDYILTQKIRS